MYQISNDLEFRMKESILESSGLDLIFDEPLVFGTGYANDKGDLLHTICCWVNSLTGNIDDYKLVYTVAVNEYDEILEVNLMWDYRDYN